MKRLYIILTVIAFTASYAGAQIVTERCWHLDKVQFLQHKQDFWRSHSLFSTSAQPVSAIGGGFYNLTELQYGFGLSDVNPPFSNHYAGITTAFGWSFGSGLALGGGTGYYTYNEGYAIPLYADLRYFMGKQRIKFFVALPGGFLMNFDNFRDFSRAFVNPSAGLVVPLSKGLHLSFSAGLFTQYNGSVFTEADPRWRDSFVNMRLGLLFGR